MKKTKPTMATTNTTTSLSRGADRLANSLKFSALLMALAGAVISMIYCALILTSAPGFFVSLAVAGFVWDPLRQSWW